jgi:hypothetical protein
MANAIASAQIPSSRRLVRVQVLDARGQPFYGATIEFLLQSKLIGKILNSAGAATISYSASHIPLEIRASGAGASESQFASGKKDSDLQLSLPVTRSSAVAPKPIAECPSGQQGQPCVDCPVPGGSIRLCG